jgi:hypothetical protein
MTKEPVMNRNLTALTMAAAMLAITVPMSAAPRGGCAAVQQFKQLVAAYMTLHERVEKRLPPLRVCSDAREIDERVDAMANAMRSARPDAKVGDIFTPNVAVEFRRRLAEGINARGDDPAELLAQIAGDNGEDEAGGTLALVVNQPLGCGLAMTPPFVFDVLPSLPGELQYRFVGRDLVLLDIHAELIVDILRDALPAM